MDMIESGMAMVLIPFFLILIFTLGVSLVFYLLESFGLYRMSVELGERNAWFSFLPVLKGYQTGKIAERLPDGKFRHLSKLLLILHLLMLVVVGFVFARHFSLMFRMIGFGFSFEFPYGEFPYGEIPYGEFPFDDMYAITVSEMSVLMIGYLLLSAVSIAYTVFYYIALWRIFKLFAPENAVLFVVLSILINICGPILLFVVRNNRPALWNAPPEYPDYPSYPQD